MESNLLNWYQALQLLALGPCLFMLFFMCVAAKRLFQVFVPVLYFLSLICSFCIPLSDALVASTPQLKGVLLMGESLTPALSFLLIIQFISDRIPPAIYWSILAIPLLGGSSIVYSTLIARDELCIYENLCTEPLVFKQLYEIFSASLTFLLTIVVYNRMARMVEGTPHQRQHKYALIIALVVLNLALLGIDLAQVGNHIEPARAAIAMTVVRIGFIYLVLTSVLRVFDRSMEIAFERIPHVSPSISMPSERDQVAMRAVNTLLAQEKLYRTMDLSRGDLAAKLALTEHNLSRIVNLCTGQNLSMLVNQYRVNEAKERLAAEETPVTVIAFEVGFNSIPSFNRVFRQMASMSPSEYRQQRRKS